MFGPKTVRVVAAKNIELAFWRFSRFSRIGEELWGVPHTMKYEEEWQSGVWSCPSTVNRSDCPL